LVDGIFYPLGTGDVGLNDQGFAVGETNLFSNAVLVSSPRDKRATA